MSTPETTEPFPAFADGAPEALYVSLFGPSELDVGAVGTVTSTMTLVEHVGLAGAGESETVPVQFTVIFEEFGELIEVNPSDGSCETTTINAMPTVKGRWFSVTSRGETITNSVRLRPSEAGLITLMANASTGHKELYIGGGDWLQISVQEP